MELFETTLSAVYGGKVLDVATGRGDFIECISRFQHLISITALDKLSEPEGFTAQFAPLTVQYATGDAKCLPFENASFDTVCISNSLHHMQDPNIVLNEMLRVLKPSGTFIVNEMYSDTNDEQRLTHVLLHHWWGSIDSAVGVTHNITYTKNDLKTIFSSLAVEEISTVDYSYPAETLSDEQISHLLNGCDRYLERVKIKGLDSSLIKTGEELKQRVIDIGFASAPSLLFIGKKA